MKVNKKTDLAIRILKYLYETTEEDYISGNKISQDLEISYHHLRRIIPLLNDLGYVVSRQGKDGGVKLTANASTIAIEKLLLKTEVSNTCINDCANCVFNNNCTFEKHAQKAARLFCSYFKDIYIKDL